MSAFVCRRCGREIREVYIGEKVLYGHTVNPKDKHHPVVAKISPETDTERKEAWGR